MIHSFSSLDARSSGSLSGSLEMIRQDKGEVKRNRFIFFADKVHIFDLQCYYSVLNGGIACESNE